MLGVSLLYVGAVLTINGIGRLTEIDGKSLAVMNFFTGGLSVIANVILLVCGEYYAAATGLLFGFTYLFIGLNAVFNLDGRVLGWFSLFVAINTVPAALLSLLQDADPLFFVMGDPVAAHLRGKCPEKGLASYSSSSVDLGGNRHCLGSRLAAVAKCFVTVT